MAQRFKVFAHGCSQKGSADYTKGIEGTLDGAQSLETRWGILPPQGALVERALDVSMNLEDDRQLVRQRHDWRAPRLASKPFLPIGIQSAATDAAVFRRYLLDGGLTTRTCANFERSDVFQKTSDLHVASLFVVPAETIPPPRY
jgi:hypothetical protein